MTKIQRQKHINSINQLLIENGFELDRWGTYRKGNLKFNTKETNIKIFKDKTKKFSEPMVNITLERLQEIIKKLEG